MAEAVGAPAGNGTVGSQTAREVSARTNRREATGGRPALIVGVGAPAGDGSVGPRTASKSHPALTEEKVPAGGVAWPKVLSPQQAMVPSVFTPHAAEERTLMEEKAPPGVGTWVPPYPVLPQQAMVPSVLTRTNRVHQR